MIITFDTNNLSDTGRFYLDILRRQDIKEYTKTMTGRRGRLNTKTATILLRSLRPSDRFITFVESIPDKILENDQITGAEKIDLAGLEIIKKIGTYAPVGVPITPEQWMSHFAPEYGLKSRDYLINMCRGMKIDYRTKRGEPRRFVASLPEPFKAERIGSQWLIYV